MSINQGIKQFLYDSYYKNFLRRTICAKRPLPRLLIIGAQKSGTTTLFNYLITNSSVSRPLNKEIHFFSFYYHKGVSWYKTHFPKTLEKSINFEASTSYLIYPKAAERAYSVIPGAKIIAILRNPIERAYSHFWHTKRIGKEPSITFEEALSLEQCRENTIQSKLKANKNYCYNDMYRHAYLKRGIYADQIEIWLKFFQKENILVIESGRLFNAPYRELEKISSFLNIPNAYQFAPSVFNKGKIAKKMLNETRNYLESFYKPHNRRLFELIQEEFEW